MSIRRRGFIYIIGFIACALAVGIACSTLSPSASSSSPTEPAADAVVAPTTGANDANDSGLVSFTDQNNYFVIDLPSDWTHSQEVDSENNYWYWDVFTAPDGHAKVENVVYDDGTAWTGSKNGQQALYLLNTLYSSTGAEGDIRISNDSIQKDGSERLTWSSRGGSYAGVSFFEVRNRTAFLMFTTWWDNDYADKYSTVLDDVISSYRLP
jgi:hypothetical protein